MSHIFHVEDRPEGDTCDHADEEVSAAAGYSAQAIKYYTEKPYWGVLPDADQVTEMTGTCGDTMTLYLKIDQGVITDVKILVLGCPGAVAAAMATGHLIMGKALDEARAIDDADVFENLAEIPPKKHHCIQLAVKTLHLALDAYNEQNT